MGYALGYLIRLILQLLLRWHESEKRQQEDREWEVRERNRRRKRALQGDTSAPVSEDAWREGPADAGKEDKSLSGQADARFKRRVRKLNLERKPGKSVGLIASTTLVYGFIGFLCLVGFCALGTIVVCLGAPMALPRASPGKQAQAPNSPPPKEQPKPPDVKKPAEQPPK